MKLSLLLTCVLFFISFSSQAEQTIYIQAAACHKQRCVDTYRSYIENLGYPSQVKYTQQHKDKFKVLSRLTNDRQAAEAFVQLINADKRVRVTAKIEQIDKHLYIDLGEQSNHAQAQWLVNFAAHLASSKTLPANQLSFSIKHQIEQMFAIKILSGPFKNKNEAEQALTKIKSIGEFSRAFIVLN